MVRFYKMFCLSVLISFLLTSCQNEGNIGDFYGQWALMSSTVDGQKKDFDNIYFSFQGKVVWAKRVNYENHGYKDVFGSFAQQGDSLFLKFIEQNIYITPKQLIEEECGFEDANNVRTLIRTIDQSNLILESGNNIWVFEKY